MSRHDLHGKMSNGRGTAGHSPFISGDKWYISRERNKEIRTTIRRVDELLKCRQERFNLCCIHIVSLVINHHR